MQGRSGTSPSPLQLMELLTLFLRQCLSILWRKLLFRVSIQDLGLLVMIHTSWPLDSGLLLIRSFELVYPARNFYGHELPLACCPACIAPNFDSLPCRWSHMERESCLFYSSMAKSSLSSRGLTTGRSLTCCLHTWLQISLSHQRCPDAFVVYLSICVK